MAGVDVTTYALSKGFTEDTADALGAVKGAPCTAKVEEVTGGHKVTLEWTGTSGAKQSQSFVVKDGEGVKAGGETGQILAKKSDADYDTEWIDAAGSVIDDNLTADSDNPVKSKGIFAVTGNKASLTTTAKGSLVSAINELDSDIGDLSTLTTAQKAAIVAAVNELDRELGNLSDLTTTAKTSAVAAINEHDTEIGNLTSLTTTAKSNLVAAVNEHDSEIGVLSTLKTSVKNTIVAAVNAIVDMIGSLSSLTTTAKNTVVAAINELDSDVGDKATLKTTAKTNLVAAANELVDKDTAQDTEIAALANSGAKNLLNPNGNAVQTQFGVTFTRNTDGSITVSGTATDRAQYTVGMFNLAEGAYRLTGAPSGASQTTHALYERVHPYAAGVALNYDEGNGKNFTVTSATAGTHAVIIDVKSGQTLDNVVYYPMVRKASITDDTYVPYAMSNAELTAKKQDVGDYVLNGGATGYADFKFSKSAHVQNMRRGNNQYSNGLSILGENSKADLDGVIREWLRYERHTGQLQGYIYKEGATSWEAVHSWQADEDTGWQSATLATGQSGTIQYRKKNGMCAIYFTGFTPANDFAAGGGNGELIFTLPSGCAPKYNSFFTLAVADWTQKVVVAILGDGSVRVKSNTGATLTKQAVYGEFSFLVG